MQRKDTKTQCATTKLLTLRWFIPLTNWEESVRHTKFRREEIHRVLRRHSGIGIQRCCRNKKLLPLALDTQSLSKKESGKDVTCVYELCSGYSQHANNVFFTTSSSRWSRQTPGQGKALLSHAPKIFLTQNLFRAVRTHFEREWNRDTAAKVQLVRTRSSRHEQFHRSVQVPVIVFPPPSHKQRLHAIFTALVARMHF